MRLRPAVAVITPPPQDPNRPFGVATNRPVGKESVKAIPVKVTTALGFVIEKVTCTGTCGGTDTKEKDLVVTGGFATVSVSAAVFPVPTFEPTALAVLVLTSSGTASTFTL